MLRKLLLNGAAHTTSSARLRLRFASEAPWREGSLPRRQEERKEAGAVVAVARKLCVLLHSSVCVSDRFGSLARGECASCDVGPPCCGQIDAKIAAPAW